MKNYEDMEIIREYSRYPRGLKHKSKETLIENSLFDFELIVYKIKAIAKGHDNEARDKTRSEKTSNGTTEEVLRGHLFRLLHADRHTAGRDEDSGAIEDRYIEDAQGKREAEQESDSKCKEETETQTHED